MSVSPVWTKFVGFPIIDRSILNLWWWRLLVGLGCCWMQQENSWIIISPVLAIFLLPGVLIIDGILTAVFFVDCANSNESEKWMKCNTLKRCGKAKTSLKVVVQWEETENKLSTSVVPLFLNFSRNFEYFKKKGKIKRHNSF